MKIMQKLQKIEEYIEKYRHKAAVLTRIHSDLANRNDKRDLAYTVAIVGLTALITFLGFIGTDRILEVIENKSAQMQQFEVATTPETKNQKADKTSKPTLEENEYIAPKKIGARESWLNKARLDFGLNIIILLLFVASLANLIFRWRERYNSHFQSVVKLSLFSGWLNELTTLGASTIDNRKLKQIRYRYESIVEVLPPNSDKDYERAKQRMAKSEKKRKSIIISNQPTEQNVDFLREVVKSSPSLITVLHAAATVSENIWLGGGAVRTVAWNYLTGRCESQNDFDFVYFDKENLDEDNEKALEKELEIKLPRIFKVSVKNQARMHNVNGEPARVNLDDAILNWPEIATAFCLRLDKDGEIIFIAPYGDADVRNLVIRPTPYHEKHPSAYLRRIQEKKWTAHWPELKLIHAPPKSADNEAGDHSSHAAPGSPT